MAERSQVAVLEHMLAAAVALARAEHRQAREAAMLEAEARLASAQEEAEQHRPRTDAAAEWSDYQPDDDPARSTELVLRSAADTQGAAVAGAEVWRADPGQALTRSKPMILDVVLPLIAVAIVLLVVLSWIG